MGQAQAIQANAVIDHYDRTASEYDSLHRGGKDPEHEMALATAWPLLRTAGVRSILDVGCGTGRSLEWFAGTGEPLELAGIDPSAGMLDLARARVPGARLEVAPGEQLPFADGSFDAVITTGVLHHVPDPGVMLKEMLRVASKAILISDHNELAMGSLRSRRLRGALSALGLLPLYHRIRQKGRKARYNKEDGWHYPYSLLDDYGLIADHSRQVMILPTRVRGQPLGDTLALRQSHLAILAWK